MISYILAGPAEEPVSLVEAKAFLKIEDGAEDGLIGTLLAAARLHIEGVTGKALVDQTWRLVRDRWPEDGVLKLPVGPFRSLEAVTEFDDTGEPYEVGTGAFLGALDRLVVPRAVLGRPVKREKMGIEIDYVAGYGASAADVPVDLRQAVLTLVAHWHEHRDAVLIAGSGAVVPSGFDRLVQRHKRVAL